MGVHIVQTIQGLQFKRFISSHENAKKRLESNLVSQSVKMKHYGFLYREIQEKLTIKSKSTVSNTYLCYKKKEILTSLRNLLAG